jgi:hypothetical protein
MNTQKPSKQAGSIFANVALGVAAVGSVAAVTTDWTAQQAVLALQRQQGQVFTVLNDAVGNYMTLLYTQLTEQTADGKDKIPGTCATLPYRQGESEATHKDILDKKCVLSVPLASDTPGTAAHLINNALQPTLSDLKALGILDRSISETPTMPTELLVSGPDSAGAKSKALAPNGYAISIEPKCVGLGTATSTCNKTNKALISSVINIQPFAQSQYTQNFTTLLWAAGPDAAMSGPADADNVVEQDKRINPTGEFRSVQVGWTRNNPVTREWSVTADSTTTSYTRGVDSLMLMRNGYDSAYWQLARRDGSTPPTANWNFNGKDLTNVGKLTVEGTSSFTGLLSALGDLLVKGSTDLQGGLTVAGQALFKDDVSLKKNLAVDGNTSVKGTLTADSLTVGGTHITKDGALLGGPTGLVSPGAACSTNFALAQSTNGQMQICRSGTWTALLAAGAQLLTNMQQGTSCTTEDMLASDIEHTGLLVCKGGVWAKTTDPVTLGSTCSPEGRQVTLGSGNKLYCMAGAWTDMPPYFAIRRAGDNMVVHLNRPIKFNGSIYGVYNEPDLGGMSTSQRYQDIVYWMLYAWDPVTVYTGRRGSRWWLEDRSAMHLVEIATAQELYAIQNTFGGRPPAWNFPFQDGEEVWTANRRDECDDGCGMGWSGGGGNWWDHITVDIWNNHTFHRYNTDKRPVILKMSINPR